MTGSISERGVAMPPDAGHKIPSGWRRVRLGDICGITAKQVDPRIAEFAALPHVNGTRIESGTCRLLHLEAASNAGLISGKYLFDSGDVLYSKLRPYLRKVVVAESRGVCSADMYPIRVTREMVDPRFLARLLVTDEFTRYAIEESARARMPKLNREQLFAWETALPPLDEQHRILAMLEGQMAVVERARVAAEAQLGAAKALSAAQLRAIFQSPQSSSWPRSPLGRVADLLASRSIASDGDTPVQTITTACLTEMGFSAAGVKAARMWRRDVPECSVSPDEVLVARSNTPELVGRASRFEGEPAGVVASDLTIRIRARAELLPGFLSGYLSFLYLSGYWKECSGGASGSMKKITREQIQAELVPVPPKATQREADARITLELVEARQLRLLIESRLAAINVLPGALLRRAFSGDL
jgi:type I restriction enzyme S subunit